MVGAPPRTVAMLALGAALLGAFFVIETRVEAPLLPLRLFRLSTVAGSNAVGFLLTASFYTFIFIGTLYMQQVLGFSALKTGLAWLVASITSVGIRRPIADAGHQDLRQSGSWLSAWLLSGPASCGPRRSRLTGTSGTNSAGPFFVAGMGTAFAFIPVSIGGLAGVTESDAGVASGLLNTSQQLGGAIGVAVASSIAASRFHTLIHHGYGTAAALTGGFTLALWVCGLTGLVAIPVAFVLVRRAEMTKAVASSTAPRDHVVIASPDIASAPAK